MKKWFIAKIIWQIKISNSNLASEFDEQLRLINADDADLAIEKANKIGKQHEESFLNAKDQQVVWKFIDIEFIKEISSFEDGMEICSKTIKADNAITYIEEINTKSMINLNIFTR